MIRTFLLSLLRGVGQLAFVDSARGGGLVLAGMALISPEAAVGAVVAAALATLFHRFAGIYPAEEWRLGLGGYNSAVIGILWSGAMSGTSATLLGYFPLALATCWLFEASFKKLSYKVFLPLLTAPAVVTAWLTAWALGHLGVNFWWVGAPAMNDVPEIVLGVLCIVAAMSLVDVAATVQALILAVLAAWWGHWYYGLDFVALGPLWGFAVASASFGVQAVFFRGATSALAGGLTAAILAAALWGLWMAVPFGRGLPPLLMPFVIAVWAVLLLARRMELSRLLLPLQGMGRRSGI